MSVAPRIFPPGVPLVAFPQADPRNAEMVRWCGRRIPHVGEDGFVAAWAVGVIRRRDLAAVVVFHDWHPEAGTVQLSCAADTPLWASRRVVGAILGVAFRGTLGAAVNKVWTATPHENTRAIKFNEGIGMKREAVLRHHFGVKNHAVICSILAPEWRKRYGSKEA